MKRAEPTAIDASFLDLCRGDFSKVSAIRGATEALETPETHMWESALSTTEWLAGLRADLAPLPIGNAVSVNSMATSRAVAATWHAALLRWDQPMSVAALELVGTPASNQEHVAVGLARLATDVLAGESNDATRAALESLSARAMQDEEAAVVVETTAFRALHALRVGDLDEATKLGRRASRMGRTEAIPQAEYLANTVLARLRREAGHADLATRILVGLCKVVPPSWHGWIAWELVMARGIDAAPMLTGFRTLDDSAPPRVLLRVLECSRAGDVDTFDETLATLHAGVRGWWWPQEDVRRLRAALDPRDRGKANEPFRQGAVHEVPAGMTGLPGDSDGVLAYVCAGPDSPARRVVASGAALFRGAEAMQSPQEGKPGRTETALCILAFAGQEGLDAEQLFDEAYGFPFEKELHGGVLRVLIHRARTRLAGAGELQRVGSRLRLELSRRVVLPDPRCSLSVETKVLRFVAEQRGVSAKEASKALGVSLRGAQAALQELVSEGVCHRTRDGRQFRYVLEDTTFLEPTIH